MEGADPAGAWRRKAGKPAAELPDCLYWNPADPTGTPGFIPITRVSAPYRPLGIDDAINLLRLANFESYARVTVDGMRTAAFTT